MKIYTGKLYAHLEVAVLMYFQSRKSVLELMMKKLSINFLVKMQ